MTEVATEPVKKKKLQELVVYHLVNRDFEWSNIYAMGGLRPNAKWIAVQYDCKLEFRQAQYRDPPNTFTNPRYLGIDDDGSGIAAVLLGESREQLAKARNDILRTFGGRPIDGHVSVSDEKTIFG